MEVMKLAGRLGAAPCSRRRAAAIDQDNATVTTCRRAFHQPAQRFEHRRHRIAARNHFEQPLFTREQRFRPLAVVDIGVQKIPHQDASCRVPQRESAHLKPPVGAIGPTAPPFKVERLAGFDRLSPGGADTGAVVRMKCVSHRPGLQLLKRRAEIVNHLAVDEFQIARGRHQRDQRRNFINDRAKTVFARPDGVLGLPAVVDIDSDAAPFDDRARCVRQADWCGTGTSGMPRRSAASVLRFRRRCRTPGWIASVPENRANRRGAPHPATRRRQCNRSSVD